jgi:hypothetical protein
MRYGPGRQKLACKGFDIGAFFTADRAGSTGYTLNRNWFDSNAMRRLAH